MLLVRVLGSCETMANASVVCTDKTGTLTQNDMTVVAGSVGIHAKFVRELAENQMRSNADEQETPPGSEEGRGPAGTATGTRKHPLDFSLDQKNLDVVLGPQLRTLFNDAICINSTAFEDRDPETKELIFVGSKTETALLKFAKELGWPNWKIVRESAQIVQMIPFSSQRKAMGVVFKLPNGKHRLFLKGASEILTMKCTRHVVVRRDAAGGSTDTGEVETEAIDETATDNIQRTIIFYANQTLRTIALCYRDFPSWPPPGARFTSEDEVRKVSAYCACDLIQSILGGIRRYLQGVDAHCHYWNRRSLAAGCP
jgi:Ca2+-transporting ATPase